MDLKLNAYHGTQQGWTKFDRDVIRMAFKDATFDDRGYLVKSNQLIEKGMSLGLPAVNAVLATHMVSRLMLNPVSPSTLDAAKSPFEFSFDSKRSAVLAMLKPSSSSHRLPPLRIKDFRAVPGKTAMDSKLVLTVELNSKATALAQQKFELESQRTTCAL